LLESADADLNVGSGRGGIQSIRLAHHHTKPFVPDRRLQRTSSTEISRSSPKELELLSIALDASYTHM
jgi:hypothetical protein